MKLFLLGLPGSGKSTLGRELASFMGYKLTDTDTEIVKSEGKSIESIFASEGEDYFRKREQEILHRISSGDNVIVSTGGGTPCFYDNMEFMSKNGITVFLDVPVVTIHQRLVQGMDQSRPMLKGKTPEQVLDFLQQKYSERIPYYSKAILSVTGSNIKAKEIYTRLVEKKLLQ